MDNNSHDSFTGNGKNVLIATIVILLLSVFFVWFSKPSNKDTIDLKTATAESLFNIKKMPPCNKHQYMQEEYRVLTDVNAEGFSLRRFEMMFNNTKDISNLESLYDSYKEDMKVYIFLVKNDTNYLRAMNPTDDETIKRKKAVIKRLDEYIAELEKYEEHAKYPKETAKYLKNCQFLLGRLFDVMVDPRS